MGGGRGNDSSSPRRAAAALAGPVLIDGVTVTGLLDWSEAAPGDAAFDLASLTLAHPDRLGDLLGGYGDDIDRDRIHAWWSYRCLTAVRWLIENGYGPPDDYPEVAMLRRSPEARASPHLMKRRTRHPSSLPAPSPRRSSDGPHHTLCRDLT
jgi:hypothetical protein